MNYDYTVFFQVLSCWRDSSLEGVSPGDMSLQIGHNHFLHNEAVATRLSPLVRATGRIEHNDYLDNADGAIYVHNDDDFILEIQHVDLTVFENRFKRNRGSYVLSLGLSHYDYLSTQSLFVHFNWVQENLVTEPWLGLNPRSRVAAPVVIGSSNVRVERNMIDNPGQFYNYSLAVTHLFHLYVHPVHRHCKRFSTPYSPSSVEDISVHKLQYIEG